MNPSLSTPNALHFNSKFYVEESKYLTDTETHLRTQTLSLLSLPQPKLPHAVKSHSSYSTQGSPKASLLLFLQILQCF